MKALRIFFITLAILASLGSLYNISDGSFDVYQMLVLVWAWLVVYYAENNK